MKKKVCKHKWQIVPYTPHAIMWTGCSLGGGIVNEAIAVCVKCLEKRYL